MIGGSIFLLLLASTTDDPELPIGIAWRAFIETSVFITAVMLIGLGIYFAFFGKSCPKCGQKLRRAAIHYHRYGHNFDTAPGRMSRRGLFAKNRTSNVGLIRRMMLRHSI